MNKNQTPTQMEETIQAYIMTNIPESELVNKKMEEAYKEIRTMSHSKRKTKKIKIFTIAGSAAAVFFLAVTYCIQNPSLAAQLPFIGHIFENLEQKVSYPGNYSENTISLPTSSTTEDETEPYQVKSGDLSITLSEVSYDSNAIYLALLIENPTGFSKNVQNNNILSLNCQADLYRTDGSKETFSEAYGNALAYQVEGEFIDTNTFHGIMQLTMPDLEISDYITCDLIFSEVKQELTTGQTITQTLPESNETVSYIEYDWQTYNGTWNFHLDLSNLPDTKQEIVVHQINEQGFGIEKVVKTEYELYAIPIFPEEEESYDYVVTIWDADGKPLDSHGSNLEIRSTYGRDTSKVTIYLLRWEDFENCKANNSYLQPEKAIFTTTVTFP